MSEQIDALARKLAEPFGGWDKLSIIDHVRLMQAADLMGWGPPADEKLRHASILNQLLSAWSVGTRRTGAGRDRRPGENRFTRCYQ